MLTKKDLQPGDRLILKTTSHKQDWTAITVRYRQYKGSEFDKVIRVSYLRKPLGASERQLRDGIVLLQEIESVTRD